MKPLIPIQYCASPREDLRFLTFGAGGFTLYMGTSARLSGYRTRENFFKPTKWHAHDYMEVENPALFEGLPWMDMTHLARTQAGITMSIKGPMVGVGLAPGERDCIQSKDVSPFLRHGLSGGFEDIIRILDQHDPESKLPGPLDQVSIAEYCALWKRIGAHVGTIQAGCFVEMDDPPDASIAMRGIRVWLSNGDHIETPINGTRREIYNYYLGNRFNEGAVAMSVEFLEPAEP